jgi:RNA polymerase sigma factor (sigma-70 family)
MAMTDDWKGDEDVTGDLASMRRYARALARDDHDADDVVQDALLRAIERQSTFQPGRSRRRWLLAIVHNVFISGTRRRAAEARRDNRFADMLVAHSDPPQEHHARLSEIARSFAALPEHQRAVLHLTAIEGLSYQQCAELLDVPVGTVMSRLARARTTLRRREEDRPETMGLRIVGGRDDG